MTVQIKSQSSKALLKGLDDWLYHLDHLHNKDIDLGLDRIGKVAQTLGLNDSPAKIILLAGTNGKGTTSRFLEAYFIQLRFAVGVFNSPQLLHYNERVRVNAQVLADDVHVNAFAHIEAHRGHTSLTEFEFSTLAALQIFAERSLDFIIMEVGMGGREDSTNIVNPSISVITTIDIDHRAFLGSDRESIGYQKAGIFRADIPAIVGDFNIPQTVLAYANELGTSMVCANQDFSFTESQHHWCWQSGLDKLEQLVPTSIPLQNVSTALATLQQLHVDLDRDAINQVLSTLVVEGRLQQISDSPRIIVDVAHNLESAGYLARQLAMFREQGASDIIGVVGMLKDKDIEGVLSKVGPEVSSWYLADLSTPRGAKAADLAQALEKHQNSPHSCYDSVAKALEQAIEQVREQVKAHSQQEPLIIVFGSFYTVAEVLAITNH